MSRGLAIPNDRPTLAMLLSKNGYVTGQIGKWDIGTKLQGPLKLGFMEVAKNPPKKVYTLEELKEAIQTLPERCKETFKLSKQEGLDYHEIATYIGVSIKTVEAQMLKTYKILREKLCPKKRFSSNIYHNKRIEK